MRGKKQTDQHIDLGLAISGATLKYGETRDLRELAAYCGVSHQYISQLEQRALRKLRNAFMFRKDPVMNELLQDSRDLLTSVFNGEHRLHL